MKAPIIISPKPPRITFAQFCSLHNLPIHIYERGPESLTWLKTYNPLAAYRYYAFIPHLGVAENEVIYSGPCGNGDTTQSAIKNLARKMSNKEVRVDHRFISVPKLNE